MKTVKAKTNVRPQCPARNESQFLHCSRKSKQRCMLSMGHSGQHMFAHEKGKGKA